MSEKIMDKCDKLSLKSIKYNLGDLAEKYSVKVFEEIDSTNNYAKKIALESDSHKTVIIANSQTAGRGRMGRSFYSPKDNGIYLSLILKPEKPIEDVTLITVAAATSVSLCLEKMFGLSPEIKWVNDIYISKKKVCGILVETLWDVKNKKPEAVIIGIGINIKSTDFFPKELSDIAGALNVDASVRNELAAAVIKELDIYSELSNLSEALSYYREKSMLIGKIIEYEKNGELFEKKVKGINDRGNLVLWDEMGEEIVVSSGEVNISKKSLL